MKGAIIMYTTTKTRAKRNETGQELPLLDFQEAFLSCKSMESVKPGMFPNRFTIHNFWKLCKGENPAPNGDSLKSRHPAELWKCFGEHFLKEFIRENPGRRPLAWWMFGSPDSANPGGPLADYLAALAIARQHALWPAKRQAEFLRKHGLLTKAEIKKMKE
jgi:hypothetical protein